MSQNPADQPIGLTFRYTQREYVRALRAHYANRLNVPLDLVVAVVTAGGGAYLWIYDPRWLGAALLVLSGVFALMLIVAFFVIPPLVYRFEPKLHQEYSLTFAPDGIHFRTTGIDSHLEWALYRRALVDSHFYLLYYGSRSFSVIPKRVFLSAEQVHAFERLVIEHIPQITRK